VCGCLCGYVYVCMYVYVCVCVYVCMCLYMCMSVVVQTCSTGLSYSTPIGSCNTFDQAIVGTKEGCFNLMDTLGAIGAQWAMLWWPGGHCQLFFDASVTSCPELLAGEWYQNYWLGSSGSITGCAESQTMWTDSQYGMMLVCPFLTTPDLHLRSSP